MPSKRCDMCFQPKNPLTPVLPGVDVHLCKACAFKVGQVVGFLEYHGISLQYQRIPEDSENEPQAKKKGP